MNLFVMRSIARVQVESASMIVQRDCDSAFLAKHATQDGHSPSRLAKGQRARRLRNRYQNARDCASFTNRQAGCLAAIPRWLLRQSRSRGKEGLCKVPAGMLYVARRRARIPLARTPSEPPLALAMGWFRISKGRAHCLDCH
ncbi:hypothetical protein DBV39_16385 [Orrella marina]|uniref:Uncharacterized protein n=1 Tax=Orrella marina TaxID=2163011 RepID=A0A2R4XML2_9BURK|nr:hypothetical protein DBV39_16385 [Orrella marina]